MALHHSQKTHEDLVARLPRVTGRDLSEWLRALDEGPAFLRFDDRVNWLRSEFGLPHGHATAIVHEYDLQRAQRNLG
ncbi:DUF4287 domain-containing protein [Thermasporomyces composti]|mgnify:CR=1 FL=1|jgi:hypothetical protein|uniref:Uncharacterized protein DUF4287 n=1 Tax=Thermasporomyces composti TaxID=696763 RepID=A0A3D9V2R0_THECX|nr:DUF4287 domain-containing protein [Thermasporomyces composti]REF35676.1 uncharacterized protein DUF4287 [Thermasporomyces composti]